MAEEEPLTGLILEIIRRRRRARLKEILDELYPLLPEEERYSVGIINRVRRVLDRLVDTLALHRAVETVRGPIFRYVWYDIRPLREVVVRQPGQRILIEELRRRLGIPRTDIIRLIEDAQRRGWLRLITPEEIEISRKIYRVQKMRAYQTYKNPELYRVRFIGTTQIPRQLVLEGFSDSEETVYMSQGVHGAVRIMVYTYRPEQWPEERLEEIMRGLFAQEGITLEIYSDRPHVRTSQAYEVKEVDIDEKPPDIGIDEVDVWVWFSLHNGDRYAYHYTRRLGGWEYRRYRVV